MSTPTIRQITKDGIVIGEMPNTGNYDADARALKRWSKERGLWNPKSKAHQMYGVASGFMQTASVAELSPLVSNNNKGKQAHAAFMERNSV